MPPTPDTQLITALAAALEPAVVKAVEQAVTEVLKEHRHALQPPAPQKQAPQKPPQPPPEKRLLSVKEVAAYLSISRSTVYVMMERGDLSSVKFGRCRRFWLEDVERLVGTAE